MGVLHCFWFLNLYAHSLYYLCLISIKIRLKEDDDDGDISAKHLNKQISG